ncbi:MAG: heme exporter protein CcmB [Gammaproteobacteria bacterium]|jgi:heme exporter protein B|nr:heme exporter protein CcmB [Gammaproteobacteria bacterium]MBT4462290.1 heme exporter protein CcmB [Gammaproteobacteria bacterium]MBT4655217.1 heme exporter protein CcmB [Gammaproteobacteria bacterium]MBT5117000.1 heme exporter protein CcmB [Gammaproteobacteria bacterium]MBT5762034.1 heme exporter protein CcmB [Gammaproteobacteria bacterium]
MKIFNIINKEFLLASRSGYEIFMPVVYLVIIMIFFNISISYVSNDIILELLPLMIWISCLLICILNIETIFKEDYDDGTLEMFLIKKEGIEIEILAKILSHWILSNLPIVFVAPLVAMILGLDLTTTLTLFVTLLIGTPTMSLIGSIAAALTISLKKNKILVSIIVLPLYVPILIFGTSAVNNSFFNMNYDTELLLMTFLFFIFLIITPLACSKALKISLD